MNTTNKFKTLFFFGADKENGFLSNFYKCRFRVDGKMYNCVEQYMHASKAHLFGDYEIENRIFNSDDPKEMKHLGRAVKGFDSATWEANKYDIVYKAVYAKFSQNEDLKEKLLSTDNYYLAECNPWDRIWGIGRKTDDVTKWGRNLLGEILMCVRIELANIN